MLKVPSLIPASHKHIRHSTAVSLPKPRELDLPRYHNYIADTGGCGYYRLLWPEYVTNISGRGLSHSNTGMVYDPAWYMKCNAVQIQRQAASTHVDFAKFLKSIQPQCGFRLIYNIDDVVFPEDIPDYNQFKHAFEGEVRQNCVDIMNLCDEIVVTCEYMRDLYRERLGKREVTVIPNFPPHFWIGHQYDRKKIYDNFDKHKRKPRILYAGSGAHFDIDNRVGQKDDFEHVIKTIIDTRSKYQWVFIGGVPRGLDPYVKSGEIEVHPWVDLMNYPTMLSNLNVQLAIAPLQDNSFNRSKSDIKAVEAGMLGIPFLVQDMCTYDSAPAELKFNNNNFAEKIEKMLNYKNKAQYYRWSDDVRKHYSDRFLEIPQNIDCWTELLNTPYGSPERTRLAKWNKDV